MKLEIKDLIAAPFTPFKCDGEINFEIIEEYATCLRNQGVKNVYLNGTTGEGIFFLISRYQPGGARCWPGWLFSTFNLKVSS